MGKSTAPGFLLAAPTLADPNFAKTVVLMFHHTGDGAIGLVINRPTDHTLQTVLREKAITGARAEARAFPILSGGPVSRGTGWIVFESGEPLDESFPIEPGLWVSSSLQVFRRLVGRKPPGRMLFMLGYSGWGAGQLEAELETGSWIPAPLDPRILMEVPFEDRWRQAYFTLGVDPNLWSIEGGMA